MTARTKRRSATAANGAGSSPERFNGQANDDVTDALIVQKVTLPSSPSAELRVFYNVTTEEGTTTTEHDGLDVLLKDEGGDRFIFCRVCGCDNTISNPDEGDLGSYSGLVAPLGSFAGQTNRNPIPGHQWSCSVGPRHPFIRG